MDDLSGHAETRRGVSLRGLGENLTRGYLW
jgi:hypothetical protein